MNKRLPAQRQVVWRPDALISFRPMLILDLLNSCAECTLVMAWSLDRWQTIIDIVAALVTTGAILLGAFWAYGRFIRERTKWPKANLELVLTHRRLTAETTLLNATVKVHNAGTGKIEIGELRADIHQVLPMTEKTAAQVADSKLVPRNKTEAAWPCISFQKWPWDKHRPEIEPGEHEQFAFDFLVDGDLETAFIYAHLENVKKTGSGRNLFWAVSAFYDLYEPSGEQSRTNLVPGGSMGDQDKQHEGRPEPGREQLEEQREPRPDPRPSQEKPRPDPDIEKQREPRPEPQREPRPEPTPEPSPPPAPKEDRPPSGDD